MCSRKKKKKKTLMLLKRWKTPFLVRFIWHQMSRQVSQSRGPRELDLPSEPARKNSHGCLSVGRFRSAGDSPLRCVSSGQPRSTGNGDKAINGLLPVVLHSAEDAKCGDGFLAISEQVACLVSRDPRLVSRGVAPPVAILPSSPALSAAHPPVALSPANSTFEVDKVDAEDENEDEVEEDAAGSRDEELDDDTEDVEEGLPTEFSPTRVSSLARASTPKYLAATSPLRTSEVAVDAVAVDAGEKKTQLME